MKILVLGDSYACCEGVADINSWWPIQLLRRLTQSTAHCKVRASYDVKGDSRKQWLTQVTLGGHEVTIIAQTGKRSDELKQAIANEDAAHPLRNYDWVIIGTGVNNQFQYGNQHKDLYKQDLNEIFSLATKANGGRRQRVVMYSIPYWHLTPKGANPETAGYRSEKYQVADDKTANKEQIDSYNKIAQLAAQQHAIYFVNITDISARIGPRHEMLSEDQMHYSPQAFEQLFLQPLLTVIQPHYLAEKKIRESMTSPGFFKRCLQRLSACCVVEDEKRPLQNNDYKRAQL